MARWGGATIAEHTENDSLRGDGGGRNRRGQILMGRGGSEGMAEKATIRLKRAYEGPSKADGTRILVERLWPRGMTRERAAIDLWPKEIAPSAGLRKWYGHDPDRWEEFRRRYWAELDGMDEVLDDLKRTIAEGPVTFVFAARDEEHNSAVALKEYLERGPR